MRAAFGRMRWISYIDAESHSAFAALVTSDVSYRDRVDAQTCAQTSNLKPQTSNLRPVGAPKLVASKPAPTRPRYAGDRQGAVIQVFKRFSIKPSTTLESARVEISPRLSSSLQAILRRMRRMIFPERVFGKAGAH